MLPGRLLKPRGSALIIAILGVAMLIIITAAALTWSGSGKEAAGRKVEADRLAACADSARRYILAQLALTGVSPTSLALSRVLPDEFADAGSDRQTQILSGHYSTASASGATPAATVVAISSASMGGSDQGARDLANALPGSATLGGQYYRVVVKCRASPTREAEYEYVFRYGI